MGRHRTTLNIIDVYDALTSERPYKTAFSPADALSIIRGSAGTQFDPQLVEHFVSIYPEFQQQMDALSSSHFGA